MKASVPIAALALALCLGSVLANDLQLAAKVFGCNGEVLPNADVRISGCVDDGLTGPGAIGITAKTNASGIAWFQQDKENSIQYCWGAAEKKCKVEVVGGVGSLTYSTLGLLHTSQAGVPELVSPREWLCKAKGCCKPCAPNNAQEASCTKFIYYGMLEFRPTVGCPPLCCPDECTAQMLFKFGRIVKKLSVKGTCSGRLQRDKPHQFSMRNMLSVVDNDVIEAAMTGKELDGIPEDFLSAASFLNDDGTLVDTRVAATIAPEISTASSAAGLEASSSRRLKTWGRKNDKDDKHADNDDDDDDDDDDKECPSGWLNSKRPCDVTGCGTCCVRMIK